MTIDRMLTLAGFNPQRDTVQALEESKRILVEAHDRAIEQAKNGLPLDEGLFTGLRAAVAAAASVSGKVAKSVARKAAELSDNVRKIYQDEKAKLELKELLKGMGALATSFEALEKKAPTLLKKDERVREIVKVFRDAMDTMLRELQARAVPPERVEPELAEAQVMEMIKAFLEDPINEDAGFERRVREFMQAEGYMYKNAHTIEEIKAAHIKACKNSPRLSDSDKRFCDLLGIPTKDGKIT